MIKLEIDQLVLVKEKQWVDKVVKSTGNQLWVSVENLSSTGFHTTQIPIGSDKRPITMLYTFEDIVSI